MNRFRMAAFAVLLTCAVSLGAAGTASAQEPLTRTVELTGTKGFNGTYTIKRFAVRNGQLVTVGTVEGTMRKNGKTRRVSKSGVRLPATVAGAASGAQASQQQPPPDPLPPLPPGRSCSVLSLDLGPINLNLLGLVVRTNEIQLRIDAVQGPGNLLGNLLCAITGILNPQGAAGPLTQAINQLTAALNAILALVPRTA